MSEEKYKYLPVSEDESDFNIGKILNKYKVYWPWFFGFTVVLMALAVCYIMYSPRLYTSAASIIVNDEESASKSNSANGFDFNLFSGLSSSRIANELGLLASKRLMFNTVKALDLNVQYIDDSNFISQPLYTNSPVKVQILRLDEKKLERLVAAENNLFRLKNLKAKGLRLTNVKTGEIVYTDFDTPVEFEFSDFVIVSNSDTDEDPPAWDEVLVRFATIESVATFYHKGLEVSLLDDNSTLIQLKLNSRVPEKGEDILNQLIYEYNREAIEDKNLIAKNTADFIDDRLNIINRELDSVESGKESFKESNRLTNIDVESDMMIQNVSEYNQERQQVATELEVTNSLLNYMDSERSTLLPANLGLESNTDGFVDEYNKLILERDRLLGSSTEKNPLINSLNNQIDQLKTRVKRRLESQVQNLEIKQDNLQRRIGFFQSKISRVPGQERQVRVIERQQNIKESLYLYLLQKREENTLELSVTGPKAKIVDSASASAGFIKPSPKVVLGAALVLGFLFPVLVIRAREVLNDRIQGKDDLERIARNIPILGELPLIGQKDQDLVKKYDRSVLSEAFRILIANIQFLNIDNPSDKGVTCFVTSSIKGEGKTFVATNLAITLALTEKKVILVGGDLRDPQIQRYHKKTGKNKGVSDYLVNRNQKLCDLYQDSEFNENLKVLPAGTIPPNPAELIQSSRLGEMFAELEREFDYVIVDCAPALLVADTFLMNKYATLTLFVVRNKYTKRDLMNFAIEANQKRKLKKMCFLINGVAFNNLGYGNQYGYGIN